MSRMIQATSAALLVGLAVAPAAGQTPASKPRSAADQKQSRYQIGVMERVLEGAVEHGVSNIRDRLQTLGPTDLMLSDNAKARGFRLDGYGVFFDVIVPSFDTSTLWATRTLDRNDLGLDSALRALQAHVDQSGDANLEQALRRIELQVAPAGVPADRGSKPGPPSGARNAMGSAAVVVAGGDAAAQAGGLPTVPSAVEDQTPDPILADPDEAYRKEVVADLMDVMLAHSSSLEIAPTEWLTVAARRNEERPRLSPADSNLRTIVIRLKGSDLAAFLARQISKDDVLQRFEVRVF